MSGRALSGFRNWRDEIGIRRTRPRRGKFKVPQWRCQVGNRCCRELRKDLEWGVSVRGMFLEIVTGAPGTEEAA